MRIDVGVRTGNYPIRERRNIFNLGKRMLSRFAAELSKTVGKFCHPL